MKSKRALFLTSLLCLSASGFVLQGCQTAECLQMPCNEAQPQPTETKKDKPPSPTSSQTSTQDNLLQRPAHSSDLPPDPSDVPTEGLAEFHPCNKHTKCADGLQCIVTSTKAKHGTCLRMVSSCDKNTCGTGRVCMKLHQGGGGTCFKHCTNHSACPHSQHCVPIQNHGVVDLVCLPG